MIHNMANMPHVGKGLEYPESPPISPRWCP